MTRIAKQEQAEQVRPPLTACVEDMAQYDIIFLGYPIWYQDLPMPVYTFLESYDLQGKTIIPVATSGGSGMGNTNKELAVSCKGAVLKEGRIFSKSVSESDLKTWVDTVTE